MRFTFTNTYASYKPFEGPTLCQTRIVINEGYPEKFEPVDEQVSGNGDFAKRCRNYVVNGRGS